MNHAPITNADAITIVGALRRPGHGAIDPITVVLLDHGGGGKIIVEVFGTAWAAYFGAIGGGTLRQFLASCDADYLGGKLAYNSLRTPLKREVAYTTDIAAAIIETLRGARPWR